MRIRRLGLLVVAGGLMPALLACSADADPNLAEVGPDDFPAHSTMQRIAGSETIRIGVTGNDLDADDVPLGFEVELGQMIAGALGIPAHEITWVQTEPTEHERLVEDGFVDVLMAGFAIDDQSLEIVDFAGPYHIGGQALVVPVGAADASGTMAASGTICTTADVADTLEPAEADILVERYAECVSRLRAGDVDGLSAADLTAAGEVDDQLTVLDDRPTEEAYGIALAKGDDEFRDFLNDVLEAAVADGRWAAAWSSTAEPVLGPADPPALDRY